MNTGDDIFYVSDEDNDELHVYPFEDMLSFFTSTADGRVSVVHVTREDVLKLADALYAWARESAPEKEEIPLLDPTLVAALEKAAETARTLKQAGLFGSGEVPPGTVLSYALFLLGQINGPTLAAVNVQGGQIDVPQDSTTRLVNAA
jgi:hypothetical protein